MTSELIAFLLVAACVSLVAAKFVVARWPSRKSHVAGANHLSVPRQLTEAATRAVDVESRWIALCKSSDSQAGGYEWWLDAGAAFGDHNFIQWVKYCTKAHGYPVRIQWRTDIDELIVEGTVWGPQQAAHDRPRRPESPPLPAECKACGATVTVAGLHQPERDPNAVHGIMMSYDETWCCEQCHGKMQDAWDWFYRWAALFPNRTHGLTRGAADLLRKGIFDPRKDPQDEPGCCEGCDFDEQNYCFGCEKFVCEDHEFNNAEEHR